MYLSLMSTHCCYGHGVLMSYIKDFVINYECSKLCSVADSVRRLWKVAPTCDVGGEDQVPPILIITTSNLHAPATFVSQTSRFLYINQIYHWVLFNKCVARNVSAYLVKCAVPLASKASTPDNV